MTLCEFMKQECGRFEQALTSSLENVEQERLRLAMEYSLMNGGKRVRPLLLLAVLHALGKPVFLGYASAIALEYIHTYSLIHDDLPAMDNDDFRRGKLTSHKQFDEATAILAGDSLQTMAFDVLSESQGDAKTVLNLVRALAKCAGPNGMIGGQMADIQAENKRITLDALMSIHQNKTGKLIWFAVYAATQLANISNELAHQLLEFAHAFGLAFQIHNDLKDIKQDEKLQKSTYVSLLGKDEAMHKLHEQIYIAERSIEQAKAIEANLKDTLLLDFLEYVKL
ncbi:MULTISPECIES: polyprenyl synthetase family protein [unclassified Granulicatella]|uniref:polyprenyl synthetase family protein n=1 Tax=unclassified Granulicatella TaxID=2630493 RepID=UPI0010739362|nr:MULTISPECIES: farnesyl diphosphate synthase [unclassified Granulicatella]MBF0780399.1 polyprenyl synthetase family protein [Granulicatella sp. 19428wC4_WM01]TFU95438.1 polyprenyl synthetase family protein [Granulicatella sp. WM01]